MAGAFVWFDLSTSDPAAAVQFYTALLGWAARGAPYVHLEADGIQFGGVSSPHGDASAPPHWMGYVAVDDVGRAVARSESLGGATLVGATDLPGTGRFAVVADPTGAVLALFSGEHAAHGAPPAVAWTELNSTDPERSFAYLAAMFGWRKGDSMDMPDGNVYQMLVGEGEAFAGLAKSQAGASAWAFYFAVADCRAAFAQAAKQGCRVLYPPMEVPGGWAALLLDPQGAAFGLFSMA